MGLFGLNRKPKKNNRIISIDASLGNVVIAGNSRRGAETIMSNYAIDSLNKGYGVVIFRDMNTGISAYPNIASINGIYSLDCTDNSVTDQIDIFSGMSDVDINAYIIKIFDMYNEIEKTKRMSYQNYVALLRHLVGVAGKRVDLSSMINYPIDVLDNYNRMYCSGAEQMRTDRFLNAIRPNIQELESYFFDFGKNVAGYILSGRNGIDKIFGMKSVLEVSLDFPVKPSESLIIMTVIVDAINRLNRSAASVSSINVIADGVPNDILIKSGLQNLIKGGKGYNVLYTVQDISNLVEQSNEWIDYADSYFFFRQNSSKNKEFCSDFFGTYETVDKTVTTGSNSSGFFGGRNGGFGGGRQNSVSVRKEQKPVCAPEIFSKLSENEAVFYSKDTNEHTVLQVF